MANVAISSPPITARPSGAFCSPPSPIANAMGIMPMSIARAVIITALPAALAGIVWVLFATATTLSVPALTGAIMCMGVATANSILVISFARERLAAHGDAVLAAVEAGFSRFRPVCMTALAMIIGMSPMALGLGEGGEQNAPLGRAVIGGLVFATAATLIFVPVVFSIIHDRHAARRARKAAGPAQSGEAYA